MLNSGQIKNKNILTLVLSEEKTITPPFKLNGRSLTTSHKHLGVTFSNDAKPPPKSEYFFKQHWESEYFFRKKPYPPPPSG
jgi:arylamine N-acetyltransferase